jgi:hypothetical protein
MGEGLKRAFSASISEAKARTIRADLVALESSLTALGNEIDDGGDDADETIGAMHERIGRMITEIDIALAAPHIALSSREEISEAKVERVAKTLYAQHRAIEDVALPKWDELTDFQRYAWTERARTALEAAAREG